MECEIIRDLLPLYADGVAGEASRELVRRHLESCPACRAELERMQTELEGTAAADTDCAAALRRRKRRMTRRTAAAAAAALLAGVALCLGILWKLGVFYIVDRQTSPNGAITTTVYSRDVTGFFPTGRGCTLRDQGEYLGTTIYGGTFDGLWWSPNSRHQVVSLMEDHGVQMWLHDYHNNSGGNLTAWVSTAAQAAGMVPDAPLNEMGWPDVEFRFIQWGEDSASMLLRYDYVDRDGLDRAGYFWYNCETGAASGQMELESRAVRGVVTQQGRHQTGDPFYTMVLDSLDENGNQVEFVFSVVDGTEVRGSRLPAEGDHVMVVYRPSEGDDRFPALSVRVLECG